MLNRVSTQSALALLLLLLPLRGVAFELVDSDGQRHRLERPAARIISLYPGHTENLVALGAAGVLIGVSDADSLTGTLAATPEFSAHDPLEKFIAARPDCILIRPMISHSAPNLVQKLRDYGIAVISLQPVSSPELYEYWRTLGRISGFEGEAETMIEEFRRGLEEITAALAPIPVETRPRVYFESIHARMRTFAPDSISIFCLTSAGGINIAADAVSRRGTNIAGYSKERILARAGEIDVYLAQSGRMNRITVAEIVDEPGFGAIKAVRDGRIHLIDEELVSRPTPKLLHGIREIQRLLYAN